MLQALIKFQLGSTVEVTERQINKVIIELDDENSRYVLVVRSENVNRSLLIVYFHNDYFK